MNTFNHGRDSKVKQSVSLEEHNFSNQPKQESSGHYLLLRNNPTKALLELQRPNLFEERLKCVKPERVRAIFIRQGTWVGSRNLRWSKAESD